MEILSENATTIIVTLIGLVGTLITVFVTNWRKLFPAENTSQIKFEGYQPTNRYETELRLLLSLNGSRDLYHSISSQVLSVTLEQALNKIPEEHRDLRDEIFQIVHQEALNFETLIPGFVEIYQKYIPIEHIHEMNKFHSTVAMQHFLEKQPYIFQECSTLGETKAAEKSEKIKLLVAHALHRRGIDLPEQ